ncbi:DUF1566 domain-containing protein [Labilibacter sediminis]|nr:DUF1566 domain-containing protein [Labilibacter sediminis]
MKTKATSIKFTLICFFIICELLFHLVSQAQNQQKYAYPIVDTGVKTYYDNNSSIAKPEKGEPFYGQDAHYTNNVPNYKDNGDGTVTDLVTGLMWQKKLLPEKYTYKDATKLANNSDLAGYNDWRLPSIKELYSLIMFYGKDIGIKTYKSNNNQPFIDTKYFNFRYGNSENNERIIDAQYASSTKYIGTTMNGNPTAFGVNFADGRIKGYPITSPRGEKLFEVRLVRGNPDYGKNNFIDNNNGTITDLATGLMWSKDDSKKGMNWKDALEWVQKKNKEQYLGFNDWRLPDAKELQSIVNYNQSPQTHELPAIDQSFFNCSPITVEDNTKDFPFYWTSTTHANNRGGGSQAVYISFGTALGWMPNRRNHTRTLIDVHGAGAQRSDPKTGNPKDYPYGLGPQGDVRRIFNYIRLVRSTE